MVLGIGFGILMRNAGYGVLWAAAMSLFIYAGSMQYVGVGLLTGGASVLTTAITTIMVNARHLFYSISMIDQYKSAGKYKPYMIFALTDETYSLLCDTKAPAGVETKCPDQHFNRNAYLYAADTAGVLKIQKRGCKETRIFIQSMQRPLASLFEGGSVLQHEVHSPCHLSVTSPSERGIMSMCIYFVSICVSLQPVFYSTT